MNYSAIVAVEGAVTFPAWVCQQIADSLACALHGKPRNSAAPERDANQGLLAELSQPQRITDNRR